MSPPGVAPSFRPLMPQTDTKTEKEVIDNTRHKRCSIACTECRIRRQKCRGSSPCAECTLHSRKCVIDPVHDKRKKMDLKASEQELQYYRTFLHQLCQVIRECNSTHVDELLSLIRQGATNENIKAAVEEYLRLNSVYHVPCESNGGY
ncbi:hypothetical protein BDV33DRAFT_185946, partial [Aspergillus novoparasiticus]